MRLYSTADIAKIAGVTRITVFRWIKNGKLKASRIGRNFVVTEEELGQLVPPIENQEQKDHELSEAVKKVVREYGDTLKKLGAE